MRIVWLRPGTANGFHCENCVRDKHLAADLLAAGHVVYSFPVYLPLTENVNNPVLYGALRMWLGTAWPLLRKLPDCINAWLDHPRLLSQVAHLAQTSKPSKGAVMTLATLTGQYDPRLDAELVGALNRTGAEPEAVLISTPLLAHQGRLAHERFQVPWYSLIGGEDHWVEQLGERKERVWELMRTESESCTAFITCGHALDPRVADPLRLDTRTCLETFPLK